MSEPSGAVDATATPLRRDVDEYVGRIDPPDETGWWEKVCCRTGRICEIWVEPLPWEGGGKRVYYARFVEDPTNRWHRIYDRPSTFWVWRKKEHYADE